VDLARVQGSGERGRITRDDVLSAKRGSTPAELSRATLVPDAELTPLARAESAYSVYRPPSHQPLPGDRTQAWSRRRTAIAEHMRYSLATAAHVAAATEIDMSRLLASREQDRVVAERQGVKLTVTAYMVQAIARSLSEHPELNATVVGQSLVLRTEKNIGVAVDTREGLVVPVIRHADELGILGIARTLSELSERARAGTLTAEDLGSGTFTLSNPGKDGNLFGISIIRQPEVGILRAGQVVKRAVVRSEGGEDSIVIRPMMVATLSYDHRVVDGRSGNAFLHAFKASMESVTPSLATQRPERR
jgi:2-oxoglutarate dehydrogenase E2 component (dihydrolipoamide succinyltransferase)